MLCNYEHMVTMRAARRGGGGREDVAQLGNTQASAKRAVGGGREETYLRTTCSRCETAGQGWEEEGRMLHNARCHNESSGPKPERGGLMGCVTALERRNEGVWEVWDDVRWEGFLHSATLSSALPTTSHLQI